MYLLLLKRFFVSMRVPDPLVSVDVYLHDSSESGSWYSCLLVFTTVRYVDTLKGVRNSCLSDLICWYLNVSPLLVQMWQVPGKAALVFLFKSANIKPRRKSSLLSRNDSMIN